MSVGSLGTGASVVGLLAWLDKIAQKGDVVRIDLYSREKMQPTTDRKNLGFNRAFRGVIKYGY